MNETKKALTVYDATYNLLRKLGLTTIFGKVVAEPVQVQCTVAEPAVTTVVTA